MKTRSESPLLTLEAVHARYPGVQNATLSNVSLTLAAGEIVCVLGPNGCGKTTLIRVLSGAMPHERGEVIAFGGALAEADRKEIAQRLAVVTQTEETAHDFSVREVVAMGRSPHQDAWLRERDEDHLAVDEALTRCRLTELAPRLVRTLSGGEQKRVQLGRALAQKPEVMLLDEPAAFLDVHEQVELYELLAEEARARNLACLIVLHDLNAAAAYGDRIVLMKRGRIVSAGTVSEVMTYRTLKETFDAELYCGVNEITQTRFFLPMRPPPSRAQN